MRKNIDEYFFLLDLLGIEALIDEKEYEKSLSIINDFYTDKNNKFNLDDLALIKDLVARVARIRWNMNCTTTSFWGFPGKVQKQC